MMLEVVAVAVVEACEVHVLGRREPLAILVVDENAANALPGRLVGLQIGLDLGDGCGAGSFRLEAAHQSGQKRVRQFERIVGVLRQRAREIGHVHFGILQVGLSRTPFAPSAHCENGDARERDEHRRAEWKAGLLCCLTLADHY
jgi:hypothetical protein